MVESYSMRDWYKVPKGFLRLCFIIINNLYCIPTYVMWMILLLPLRKVNSEVYWRIEGYIFHWLLAIVSCWSYSAGYDIVEVGDDITQCLNERTLVIANHQSTADVPLLFSCFNPKKQVLPNIMWIMDSVFKYTNFGIVSVLHKDFFIRAGKATRDKSLQEFAQHILDTYIPLKRKWLVLFPEGGFLRNRKAVSNKYAEKMNLPKYEYVTLPRVGAMHVIMDTLSRKAIVNNNSNSAKNDIWEVPRIEWILDITIAYPNAWPLDIGNIVFGNRDPCQTVLFYRLYHFRELPHDSESLTKWLFDRWAEKEQMLTTFYRTGSYPSEFSHNKYHPPKVVVQDYLRDWYSITKGFLRLCVLLIMHVYCLPISLMWLIILLPLRSFNPAIYLMIEGYIVHSLICVITGFSYSAGYDVVEVGDDITECLNERTLVIANHQSTADVPLLFSCMDPKKNVLHESMWIMDDVFKYTNFGVVSLLRKDFFIKEGKALRDKSVQELKQHILDTYIPLKRKWLVLFPEGGFLSKRKAASHRYAEKMNLPKFEHVTLPRLGAIQVVMDTLIKKPIVNNNSISVKNDDIWDGPHIKWILDIIGYSNSWPLDIGHIVFGNREPCQTVLFYRLYHYSELPQESESLTKWLFDRWEEKEQMLTTFYRTGSFPSEFSHRKYHPPKVVSQSYLKYTIVQVIFMVSTFIHVKMFVTAFNYYCYWFC